MPSTKKEILYTSYSPLTSQLGTNSWKISVKNIGPVVIYKIIDPLNYLLMTLDGIMHRGIFEHKRLKPTIIRTSQGNVQNLAQLKQIMNTDLKLKSVFNNMILYKININNTSLPDHRKLEKFLLFMTIHLYIYSLINSFMHR